MDKLISAIADLRQDLLEAFQVWRFIHQLPSVKPRLMSFNDLICFPFSSKFSSLSHVSSPFLTTGHSSSVMLNQAVSRRLPLIIMCFLTTCQYHVMANCQETYLKIPSKTKPRRSAAARLGLLRWFAFHSTLRYPRSSKACLMIR